MGASRTQISEPEAVVRIFGAPQSHQVTLRSGAPTAYPFFSPNWSREGGGRRQCLQPKAGNLRELWRPGLCKPEVSQSLVWQTFCSAKNIIPRFKFPLLNPEVQCRNGPSAHKKQRAISCWSPARSEHSADFVCCLLLLNHRTLHRSQVATSVFDSLGCLIAMKSSCFFYCSN